MTDPMPDRLIALDGCVNFRDLGGYATLDGRRLRRGRLYRSDSLHHLSERDVVHVRDMLRVGTVIDLRSTSERDAEFADTMCAPPVVYHHVPFFDGERSTGAHAALTLAHIYAFMLEGARPAIARTVGVVAASSHPTVFHCAAGKDRTGVLSAVLLGALGVPDATIIEDYVATKHGLERIVARLRASESYRYVFTDLPPDTLHAEPETMQQLLAHAQRRFGSWREYLRGAGIDDATFASLETTLLEP